MQSFAKATYSFKRKNDRRLQYDDIKHYFSFENDEELIINGLLRWVTAQDFQLKKSKRGFVNSVDEISLDVPEIVTDKLKKDFSKIE